MVDFGISIWLWLCCCKEYVILCYHFPFNHFSKYYAIFLQDMTPDCDFDNYNYWLLLLLRWLSWLLLLNIYIFNSFFYLCSKVTALSSYNNSHYITLMPWWWLWFFLWNYSCCFLWLLLNHMFLICYRYLLREWILKESEIVLSGKQTGE